jgi:hypothetical protein
MRATLSTNRLAGFGAALVMLMGLAVTAAPAAHATPATNTCVGASAITNSPGLTIQTQFISYGEVDLYSVCTSPDPTISSGSSVAHGEGPGSCLLLPVVLRDPAYTITWNNGRTSTVNLVFTDTIAGGNENVNGVGTVVAGEFAGASAVITWTYPLPNLLECATPPGVVYETGSIVLQITSL